MRRGGFWIEEKNNRPAVFLIWHNTSNDAEELIGLFEQESDMQRAYQEALRHFEAESLHWTSVPLGWSYFE